jgi:hypothetical protein
MALQQYVQKEYVSIAQAYSLAFEARRTCTCNKTPYSFAQYPFLQNHYGLVAANGVKAIHTVDTSICMHS